uniref:Uncharacterized protein n=1 Tax=Oryza glumipatula TaxID=40148 RepID=A0A0D9ZLS5_9ORYZ
MLGPPYLLHSSSKPHPLVFLRPSGRPACGGRHGGPCPFLDQSSSSSNRSPASTRQLPLSTSSTEPPLSPHAVRAAQERTPASSEHHKVADAPASIMMLTSNGSTNPKARAGSIGEQTRLVQLQFFADAVFQVSTVVAEAR